MLEEHEFKSHEKNVTMMKNLLIYYEYREITHKKVKNILKKHENLFQRKKKDAKLPLGNTKSKRKQ